MSRRHRRPRRDKLRSVYLWHRYIGLSVGILVVILAVTGILLNHTDALHLDRRYVQADFLLRWYHVEAPDEFHAARIGEHWITQVGQRLYWDETELAHPAGRLLGAVPDRRMIVVATDTGLLLLDSNGAIIDRLDDDDGVPAGMRAIGRGSDGRLYLRAAHGIYTVDLDRLQWKEIDSSPPIEWAQTGPPPQPLQTVLAEHYRGHGLPWERVLLDLHSGRIFGRWGTNLMDAAALLLIALAGTGFWTWLKRRK